MTQGYRSAGNALLCLPMVTLALAATPVVSQTLGPPADPYLDPKDDLYNPLRYITSNTLTAIAFALVVLVALIQTYYTFRYGAKWMLAMVIGAYTYAIGFGCRFGLHYHPDSQNIYIAEYLFIVLSPCAFIAADYVLFGRLVRHVSCAAHVLLPVQNVTPIFVTSDITTFVIQAIGGGMSISNSQSQRQLSAHLFLAGLVLQLVSFTLFCGMYIRFLYRVYYLERDIWEQDRVNPWYRDWRTLAAALAISCIGILVRCGYRVAELSQGYQGYLATTEAFFYGLDTLPLVIAISVYTLFWPGWFINGEKKIVDNERKSSESS